VDLAPLTARVSVLETHDTAQDATAAADEATAVALAVRVTALEARLKAANIA